MDHNEAVRHAVEILSMAQIPSEDVPPVRNFLDFGALTAYAVKQIPKHKLNAIPWFKDWAPVFRGLYDDFERLVTLDPMILYQPANKVCEEFHVSPAVIRYFMAGNRTGKTQSGYTEHYYFLTGYHPYRRTMGQPAATALIAGLPFSQYKPGVFEPKMISGEPGNPLSPMFPIGGKWFYHYDERQHILQIACRVCAEKGKAGSCPHPKSKVTLFSSELGYEVLQGAVYNLVHFDEDLADEAFFDEAKQRIKTPWDGCMIMTGTPLHGDQAWEQRRVVQVFKDGVPRNLRDQSNPNSGPLVSIHQVSQYDAGLVPHHKIKEDEATLDEFAIRARIYGEPIPFTNSPVFDRKALHDLKAQYKARPVKGWLRFKEDNLAPHEVRPETSIEFDEGEAGPVSIWEKPIPGMVYIVGIDTAAGLLDRDASCASVLKVEPSGHGVKLSMVAQYHGWANPNDYADHLMPLLIHYNSAMAIVEVTGGLGLAVVLRLKNEYAYWNLYREVNDVTAVDPSLDPKIGVDTNSRTKPFMVQALQFFIRSKNIVIPCTHTFDELFAYEEIKTGKGGSVLAQPKYQGAGGSRDDRVMSLAIAAATALSRPDIAFAVDYSQQNRSQEVSKDMKSVYAWLAEEEKATAQL